MEATFRFVVIAGLLAAGCATSGRAPSQDRNRITAEQLARVTASNAYEAIRILQPQWLDSRGSTSITDATPATAVVYIDGTRAGDLEYLRTVPLNALAEMRFLPPGEASTRYGMGLQRGVIELTSKGR